MRVVVAPRPVESRRAALLTLVVALSSTPLVAGARTRTPPLVLRTSHVVAKFSASHSIQACCLRRACLLAVITDTSMDVRPRVYRIVTASFGGVEQ